MGKKTHYVTTCLKPSNGKTVHSESKLHGDQAFSEALKKKSVFQRDFNKILKIKI